MRATLTGTRIFISYRRDDACSASGRIYDWLRIAFGREQVFRDVANIGPGQWRRKIDDALADSAVCLPVIGPRWCDATNGPRLADETDMVRHEILTALKRAESGLTLIPTLVEGATVPPAACLPPELRPLLDWNAYPLSEAGWEDDMRRLLEAVAQCTGHPAAADVDDLLARAQVAEARLADLERERCLQADQIGALTDTLHALTRQLAESAPSQRAGLSEALTALGLGNTGAAEAQFERVLTERSAAARAAREEAARASAEAAEAARHIASLARLRDLQKALRYYRRAAELDPDDVWTRFFIGDLQRDLGDLEAAMAAYGDARSLIARRRAGDPANTAWQRDLSLGHDRIGDVRVAQGDRPGALAAYQKSLDIREALARRDPANTEWQRDLSVSYNKIGDLRVAQGDRPGALAAYQKDLDIAEALARRDPANTAWQQDLSVSYNRIGDMRVAQGDRPGALAAYQKSLDIREALARRDPANTEWQRDLSVSHDRIGDVLKAQGDRPGALDAYQKGLDIREALAGRDPTNAEWQRDLIVSYVKLSEGLNDRGYARKALEVARAMQRRGILAPVDAWMVEDLKRRAGE